MVNCWPFNSPTARNPFLFWRCASIDPILLRHRCVQCSYLVFPSRWHLVVANRWHSCHPVTPNPISLSVMNWRNWPIHLHHLAFRDSICHRSEIIKHQWQTHWSSVLNSNKSNITRYLPMFLEQFCLALVAFASAIHHAFEFELVAVAAVAWPKRIVRLRFAPLVHDSKQSARNKMWMEISSNKNHINDVIQMHGSVVTYLSWWWRCNYIGEIVFSLACLHILIQYANLLEVIPARWTAK